MNTAQSSRSEAAFFTQQVDFPVQHAGINSLRLCVFRRFTCSRCRDISRFFRFSDKARERYSRSNESVSPLFLDLISFKVISQCVLLVLLHQYNSS